MAAPAKILSLDLGMQNVALAEFRTGADGGLVLAALEWVELLADPAADPTRLNQTGIAIEEMRSRMGIKGGKVNYAISAQSVFTRFVRLPFVAAQQVQQIVRFEAQQNVPFPINEVVWDYQLIGNGEAGEIEVVFVAIKEDLLNEINESVEDAGFVTSVVDVAPMALYNAFRYNYSDLTGCSLLIDIGARTTNLIFLNEGKFFSRSIPMGGSTISAAIAKEFEEAFEAAERRKIQDGFVTLERSCPEPSDPVARVSKMVRNTMTRLHAEIMRSISYFRVQQAGLQPARVYLSGGTAKMPHMREFFQQKLATPTDYFNPLRKVSISSAIDAEEVGSRAHLLGELVGLALRSTYVCPVELNLLPSNVVGTRKLRARQPYLLLAGISVLLILAGWWLYFLRAASIGSEVLAGELKPEIRRLQSLETKQKNVRKDIENLEKRAQALTEAVRQRGYWLRVLDDMNARLPMDNLWITSLEVGFLTPGGEFTPLLGGFDTSTNKGWSTPPHSGARAEEEQEIFLGLQLKGLYLDNERQAAVVDEYLNNLKESPLFDIDMERKNIVNPLRQMPTFTEWAYDFEFRLKLKKPPFDFAK